MSLLPSSSLFADELVPTRASVIPIEEHSSRTETSEFFMLSITGVSDLITYFCVRLKQPMQSRSVTIFDNSMINFPIVVINFALAWLSIG